MLKKIAVGSIILIVLVLNVLRFWKLEGIPYGYHVNELGSAVTLQCFVEGGCDANLTPWPLFGAMNYGQDKPPTFVYPGILWVKAFGSTVPSLRAYSVFVLLIGILGLFFLARQFLGPSFAMAVVLAATCSPWAWVVTRIAMESYFAPVLAIWGLYFFWRSGIWWDWMLAGFLFAAAMYAYPPARLQIPLMMATLGMYHWGRRSLRWASVFSFVAVFSLSLLPMVFRYLHGTLSRRFDAISIFNRDYLYVIGKTGNPWDMMGIFFHNYFLHLNPDFLFLRGDHSYLYSTRHSGIFSWLDIAALVIFLVFLVLIFLRPSWGQNPVMVHRRWILFLAANFFIGIIPSALTNQELPHALRMCGSWPFMMLFTGFMWWSAGQCLTVIWPVMALTGVLCGSILVYQYFMLYPQESKGMFGYWAKEKAEQLNTQEDWKGFLIYFHKQRYHCRYFMAHRLGMSCKQAQDIWQQMEDHLNAPVQKPQ